MVNLKAPGTNIDMLPLIAFVAGKGAGKSCAAAHLCRAHGYRRLSIGDPLKFALADIFGLSPVQLWGDEKESPDAYWGVSPRRLMQVVGSELFRDRLGELMPQIGHDVWARAFERRLDLAGPSSHIVVDDVRFENEAALIRRRGGILVRLERRPREPVDGHQSEAVGARISCDFVIDNNGSLKDLHARLNDLINREKIC